MGGWLAKRLGRFPRPGPYTKPGQPALSRVAETSRLTFMGYLSDKHQLQRAEAVLSRARVGGRVLVWAACPARPSPFG